MSVAPVLNPPRRLVTPTAEAASLVRRLRAMPSSPGPLVLTPVVLAVHGYHPFANDAGIYVAGILRTLNPSLYPLNSAFVEVFARHSIFALAMAGAVRITHLPLPWILLAAHLLSVFLFLTACRQLAVRLFAGERERWCVLLLAAACFTLPVAGTALFVMDPYVTARSFSTPLSLMAVAAALDRARLRTGVLLALAALFHPLMAAYAAAFVLLYWLIGAGRRRFALVFCGAALLAAALAFVLAHRIPASASYAQAVSLPERSFLFLSRWRWYEMLGLILPMALLAAAARRLGATSLRGAVCRTCLCFGIICALAAALFVPASGPYLLAALQFLRSFQLIYTLGIVLCGGIVAAILSRSRVAGMGLVILLFGGMFAAERASWPGSSHVEWPGSKAANPYQQAFLWIRDHTPRDAVFAFDPRLVYLPGEDEQGFRAIAERDHLADDKDAGVVAVAPWLADRWAWQHHAEVNVDRMTDAQRVEALTPLGASWLLLPPDAKTEFPCPWRNRALKVCRINGAS